MEFAEFVKWAFCGLISFAFYRLDNLISGLKKSVDELNLTIGIEIQRGNNMRQALDSLLQKVETMNVRIHTIEMIQAANHCAKKACEKDA